ncbi:hypothetical protein [Porphyrobacter sp. ULC335]|jgi:hypothetical protein|uniref:hypothetical protein n=1 Tax=Porphyrobacter sp. ULC335 TaxID=2854260 RepID=UPI0022211819|nr:hypothetical protein [Porphyrobacter sp. ULC335]UYV15767.1 hypothetical protein KVF90_17140 [Porphyrobacter sp. ULC335]
MVNSDAARAQRPTAADDSFQEWFWTVRLRHGIIETAEVRHAMLESDGGISIVPR